jgi:hypothetical protein
MPGIIKTPFSNMSKETFIAFIQALNNFNLPPWEKKISSLEAARQLKKSLEQVMAFMFPLRFVQAHHGNIALGGARELHKPIQTLFTEVACWIKSCPHIVPEHKKLTTLRWGRVDTLNRVVGRTTGITFEEIYKYAPLCGTLDHKNYSTVDRVAQLVALGALFGGPNRTILEKKFTSGPGTYVLIASLAS